VRDIGSQTKNLIAYGLEKKMNKQEMIQEIESLCKANKNNPYCSVYWLADMIKEIVDSTNLIEEEVQL
jgi:hypothetical protein